MMGTNILFFLISLPLTMTHRRVISSAYTQIYRSKWSLILDLKFGYHAGYILPSSSEHFSIHLSAFSVEKLDRTHQQSQSLSLIQSRSIFKKCKA